MLLDDGQVQERVARVEALLEQLESLPDASARATATETVQLLLDLYGEGLGRMMDSVYELGGAPMLESLADDELVSHLMLLHGLHPIALETRVLRALQDVRPYLESHGGNVELVRIEDATAYLRMEGSCKGCPASAMTLKLAIEKAILTAAPELARIEAEGAADEPAPRNVTFIAGPTSRDKLQPSEQSTQSSSWAVAGGLPQLAGGGLLLKEISGESVLFIKLAGDYYAYQPLCPGCGESLENGVLEEVQLSCRSCGRRYDVRRAGRCLDTPQLYLEPIPLLVSGQGIVQVAIRSAVVS